MAIVTVEELMPRLNIRRPEKLELKGPVLESLINESQAFIERYTGRVFTPEPLTGNVAVTKSFNIRRKSGSQGSLYYRIPDLRSASSVIFDGAALVDGVGYDIGDVSTEPATFIRLIETQWSTSAFATKVYSTLSIAGLWGWSPAPEDIKGVVLTLAARRFREMDASYGDTVQTPDGGVIAYFRQLPASVQGVLDSYRVPRISLVGA